MDIENLKQLVEIIIELTKQKDSIKNKMLRLQLNKIFLAYLFPLLEIGP